MACTTFEDVPKACGDEVAADGAFSLSCDGFKNVPFGCFVFNTVSFRNYPITFNITVEDETDESSSVNIAGNLTSVSVVVDTDTGLATAEATVEDPASITEIAVDTTAIGVLDGNWLVQGRPYSEVSSKYDDNDLFGVKLLACFKNFWQTCQQNNNCNPEGAKTYCTANAGAMGSQAAYEAMIQERLGGQNGFPLHLVTSTEGENHFLNVWQSVDQKTACGGVESGFAFKFSDGTQNVNLDFSTATGCADGQSPNDCLVQKVGTGIESVIQKWFPFLASDVDDNQNNAPTVTATCKYMYDIMGDMWNPNQDMMNACSQSNTCNTGGDLMSNTRNYVMKKIYEGGDNTNDPVVSAGFFSSPGSQGTDYDFSDSIVPVADATLHYGYRTWSQEGETWTELQNPERTDLGGCLQWPDWAKCQNTACTGPQFPTVIPVGQDIINYGPNGSSTEDDNKWKCSFSEKRMLVANANGYIDLGGVKYFEAQPYITINSDQTNAKHEAWSKVCDVANGSDHSYQTYPVDMNSTQIVDEAEMRANGGSPEQKKGMFMQAIYEQLTNEDHGGGNDNNIGFFTGSRQITCGEIKNGAATSGPALTMNEVDQAFKFSFGPWSVGKLLKCLMVGIHQHHGTGEIYEQVYNDLGTQFPGTRENFAPNQDGEPLAFANLKANSCIPKFQMTHMCTSDGFCSPKVICDDYNADDGGCNNGAQPASRMAHMNIEALPNSKFRFFNLDNRFDVMFNPSTNSNIVCQRAEYMSITSDEPVTASSASFDATFETTSAERNVTNSEQDCQGQDLGSESKLEMPDPKMFATFTKQ